jgi:hypothetical protein
MTMHSDSQIATSESFLQRAEERIAALEARIGRLESSDADASRPVLEEVSSRRGLFKLAGAVATGAIAHTVLNAQPAAAQVTSNTTGFQITNTSASGVVGFGVKGISNGNTASAGVIGNSPSGYGVVGESTTGYDLYAGGNGRLGLIQHVTMGPPTSGAYDAGDIIRDAGGNTWSCVQAGSGSTAKWRKLAGPGTAGTMHMFNHPERIVAYEPTPSGLTGATARAFVLPGLSTNGESIPVGARAVFGCLFAISRGGDWSWATLFATNATGTNLGSRAATMTYDNIAYKGGMFVAKLSDTGSISVYTSQPSSICLDVAGYMM